MQRQTDTQTTLHTTSVATEHIYAMHWLQVMHPKSLFFYTFKDFHSKPEKAVTALHSKTPFARRFIVQILTIILHCKN